MKEVLLLKLGEIVLKGLNRIRFEQCLIGHVKARVLPHGNFSVYAMQSTIYVEPQDEHADIDNAEREIPFIFGIVAYSRAAVCEKDFGAICALTAEYLKEDFASAKTFRVAAKRADKRFPMTSPEICRELGGYILERFSHLRVRLTEYDAVAEIEIRDNAAYVHAKSKKGAGGLPVGTNGNAMLLLSGGLDSPVSGYMMARRGAALSGVHFFSHPYTSERAKLKVIDLARILSRYAGKIRLFVVPFTHIQMEIRKSCREEYFTLIMRRFMMRISQELAVRNGCGALVTGESLGQVASQTMQALDVTGAVCDIPVLRPVIGMDKEEIVTISRAIGTYETSILPYEDCCTVFTPKHPKTKPKRLSVEENEAALDVAALVSEAVSGTEIIEI